MILGVLSLGHYGCLPDSFKVYSVDSSISYNLLHEYLIALVRAELVPDCPGKLVQDDLALASSVVLLSR